MVALVRSREDNTLMLRTFLNIMQSSQIVYQVLANFLYLSPKYKILQKYNKIEKIQRISTLSQAKITSRFHVLGLS